MAKTKTGKKEPKDIICFNCNERIVMSNDLVEKQIPMTIKNGTKRNYRRKFHLQCLHEFLENSENVELHKKEDTDWDLVYKYFRKEIMNMPESVTMSEHIVKRLKGLRLGQYYPSGNNTKILKRGYQFETILITLKVVKARVNALIGSQNFVNEKHRVDWIMKFVTGEIADVQRRIDMKNRSEEQLQSKLSNDDVYKQEQSSTPEYQAKGGRKRRGNLLGGND